MIGNLESKYLFLLRQQRSHFIYDSLCEIGQIHVLAGNLQPTAFEPGDIEQVVTTGQNSSGQGLIISASRSVIFAEYPGETAEKLRDEINHPRRSE